MTVVRISPSLSSARENAADQAITVAFEVLRRRTEGCIADALILKINPLVLTMPVPLGFMYDQSLLSRDIVRSKPCETEVAHMDDKKYQQSEESRMESSVRKRQEEFHQFLQECRDCRREIEAHWQFCAHCGIRLATHCPGCDNPLPPAGAHACPRCGLALPQVQP